MVELYLIVAAAAEAPPAADRQGIVQTDGYMIVRELLILQTFREQLIFVRKPVIMDLVVRVIVPEKHIRFDIVKMIGITIVMVNQAVVRLDARMAEMQNFVQVRQLGGKLLVGAIVVIITVIIVMGA